MKKNKQNRLKRQKGITLITLSITIIVTIVLAGVATYTGIEVINNSKFTKFTSELKIMQSYVNQWYDDLQPKEGEVFLTKVSQKFNAVGAITATEDEQARATLAAAGISSSKNAYDNYYLLKESQKEQLQIDGVEQDVLVNIKQRTVVSYLGFQYKNKMYYKLSDVDNESYNVEYGGVKVIKKYNSTLSGSKNIEKMTSKNPVIPKGFKPVDVGSAKWEYIDDNETIVRGWNSGLVIEDKDGNQFVWVPCTLEETTSEDDLVTYSKNYSGYPRGNDVNAHGVKDSRDSTNETVDGDTYTYKVKPVNEETQIEKYGGFYVARFEAGIPTQSDTHSAEENNVYSYTPVSKEGAKIWNYVDYTHSYVAAEKMIKDATKYGNNKSGLITGTQWDTIMKWYEKGSIPVLTSNQNWGTCRDFTYDIEGLYFTYNGSSLSNWSDSTTQANKKVTHTGNSGALSNENKAYYHGAGLNKTSGYQKNIADLGGNMWEWSAESFADNENNGIGRSGLAGEAHTLTSSAKRDYGGKTGKWYYVGFRVVLYVQEAEEEEPLEPPTVTIDLLPYTVADAVLGVKATITTATTGNNYVDYENSKYVINTSPDPLGEDESLYTDGVLVDEVTIINKIKAAGTYYVHALVVDSQGNAQEAISSNSATVVGKKDFDYTGAVQNIALPAGKYKIEVWGSQGSNYSSYTGGRGGYSVGTITLDETTNCYVYCGGNSGSNGAGFNGGGSSSNSSYTTSTNVNGTVTSNTGSTTNRGGGGGTDIRIGEDSLYSRVIVAGGGSGANTGGSGKYGGGTQRRRKLSRNDICRWKRRSFWSW